MVAVEIDFLFKIDFQLEELYLIILEIINSWRFKNALKNYHKNERINYISKVKSVDTENDGYLKTLDSISTFDDVFIFNFVKFELNIY
jgi:hypothetical protein